MALKINRFGTLVYEHQYSYLGLAARYESKIVECIDGPDPDRYDLQRLLTGIHSEMLDVNRWIGFKYLVND